MSAYADGFVVPVPKDRVDDYKKAAELAAQVWMEHGALEYREWVADDTNAEGMRNFPQLAGVKDHETVVLSWITFKDRVHRDEVNAKAMTDQRLADICENDPPFDMQGMAYGGFRLLSGS